MSSAGSQRRCETPAPSASIPKMARACRFLLPFARHLPSPALPVAQAAACSHLPRLQFGQSIANYSFRDLLQLETSVRSLMGCRILCLASGIYRHTDPGMEAARGRLSSYESEHVEIYWPCVQVFAPRNVEIAAPRAAKPAPRHTPALALRSTLNVSWFCRGVPSGRHARTQPRRNSLLVSDFVVRYFATGPTGPSGCRNFSSIST